VGGAVIYFCWNYLADIIVNPYTQHAYVPDLTYWQSIVVYVMTGAMFRARFSTSNDKS
jgi:hypothetical protein